MRWAWLTCASLSVAAHALTASLLPTQERPVRHPGGTGGTPTAWHMRVVGAVARPPQASPWVTAASAAAPNWEEANTSTATPTPDAPDIDSRPETQSTVALQPDSTEPDPATPAAEAIIDTPSDTPSTPSTSTVNWQGDSQYIPRPQLSLPPVPETPVIVPPPTGHFEVGRVTGILSLYIDEQGRVHHVLPSGAPMPPPFEEAARQAFMALTFHPGMLNGEPVKSRIRIEVVFDNTPLDAAAPVR